MISLHKAVECRNTRPDIVLSMIPWKLSRSRMFHRLRTRRERSNLWWTIYLWSLIWKWLRKNKSVSHPQGFCKSQSWPGPLIPSHKIDRIAPLMWCMNMIGRKLKSRVVVKKKRIAKAELYLCNDDSKSTITSRSEKVRYKLQSVSYHNSFKECQVVPTFEPT